MKKPSPSLILKDIVTSLGQTKNVADFTKSGAYAHVADIQLF